MENLTIKEKQAKYRVYDEMACENVLFTDNLQEARNCAYNYQSVLIDNETGCVLADYSC